MRSMFYVLSVLAVMGLAFWAYRENHLTRQAFSEVRMLRAEISNLREAIGVQRAEWAYLNRPQRLRELADLNFDRLGLMPLMPEQFGRVEQVAYPLPVRSDLTGLSQPVDVFGAFDDDLGEEDAP